MTTVETPQSRCVAGFGRADVTPPDGIYHRMWGAALHDRATGVHRPLTATALYLAPLDDGEASVILGLDHCLMDRAEFDRVRAAVGTAVSVQAGNVLVSMSHTHGSAWLSRSRAHLPGGDLIGSYLDDMAAKCATAAVAAKTAARPATIVYGAARCSLAAHRDYWDEAAGRFVCGFNPAGPADDTVTLAEVYHFDDIPVGTVVNYACHPTTLAWENTLVSPDYVGAMRETVEGRTGVPCLFLQGASGDLGPRRGFVGDPKVADGNGYQLGFAALSGLHTLPPPGTRFRYSGSVASGARLGTWADEPLTAEEQDGLARYTTREVVIELPYRPDLPTETDSRAELARWEADEAVARTAGDTDRVRDCRAGAERMTRQLARLSALPAGPAYPFRVSLLRLGGAVWVFTPGELYQHFQLTLRARFPRLAVVVAPLTNDWQPGYLPTEGSYGKGIYQADIAAVAAGGLETLTEAVGREIERLGSW